MKIVNGGIYGVNHNGHKSPEFGNSSGNRYHYAILVKSSWSELYLAFPITTSIKRSSDKWTIPNPHASGSGYVLLYQVKPISADRVIMEQVVNGELCVLNSNEIRKLFEKYNQYLLDRSKAAIMSVDDYHRKKANALSSLRLKCHDEIEIKIDLIDEAIRLIVIDYQTNNDSLPYLNNQLPKRTGTYERKVYIKNSFNQKLFTDITVKVVE